MQSILKAGDVGLMIKGFIEELRIIRAGYLLSYELDLTQQKDLNRVQFNKQHGKRTSNQIRKIRKTYF